MLFVKFKGICELIRELDLFVASDEFTLFPWHQLSMN